jgi:hypothetical protein
MSFLPGKKRALHKQPRQPADWYCEMVDSVESLFYAVTFNDAVHDPACGQGRIVEVARDGATKQLAPISTTTDSAKQGLIFSPIGDRGTASRLMPRTSSTRLLLQMRSGSPSTRSQCLPASRFSPARAIPQPLQEDTALFGVDPVATTVDAARRLG